jgi:hypothetical protein
MKEYTTASEKLLCHVIEIYFLQRHAKPSKTVIKSTKGAQESLQIILAPSGRLVASWADRKPRDETAKSFFNGTLTHPEQELSWSLNSLEPSTSLAKELT